MALSEATAPGLPTLSRGEALTPYPDDFADALFGRVAPEDLAQYPREALDGLSREAWAFLAEPRVRGNGKLRLVDVVVAISGRLRELTVVEAINDDMPFLLDSTLAELVHEGYEPKLVAHPILGVPRDTEGRIADFAGGGAVQSPEGLPRESFIHIHLDRIDDAAARVHLLSRLQRVYRDVWLAVRDFEAMRTRIKDVTKAYRQKQLPFPTEEAEEANQFLRWLIDDNFTLLGTRFYRFPEGDVAADPVEGSGLGILSDPNVRVLERGGELVVMTPQIRAFLVRPVALIITKANVRSNVHRHVHLDYIGVKLFDSDGRIEGELRIVGLFTSNIYTGSPSQIPYLRRKVEQVIEKAGFDPQTYSGRALMHVLETYPRDDLFQLDVDTLYRLALDVLQLTERPRLRVLPRVDEFDRFASILVFVPKDHYDTSVGEQIGALLAKLYEGRVSAVHQAFPEGPLARIQYIIGRDGDAAPRLSSDVLEAAVARIVQTWSDRLRGALEDEVDPAEARTLAARYGEAFNAAYRESFDPAAAIKDIRIIESLSEACPRAVDFYRSDEAPLTMARLKVFACAAPMPLSERVPLLENLGFRVVNERTYRMFPTHAESAGRVWLHDMTLERFSGLPIDVEALDPLVETALMALFEGRAESDGFNKLVVEAGLDWSEAAILRAYGRYLQQIRVPYAQDYLAATLVRYPEIAHRLVSLFRKRFDPALAEGVSAPSEAVLRQEIEDRLNNVTSLDDDQILRHFLNLIVVSLRTNVFQRDAEGAPRPTIAFKLDSGRIDGLPLPRPLYEIFLYSPRVEGVHLRFGKVARGGLRWSDRPQDFRTEVLGLVKAQQVKNAVIVPVGAKGGFFPKRLPPASERQAWLTEGTEAYKIFVSTLLDLTDNIEGDRVLAPALTVRHDGDDPYLVVAADKGTATFSDIANGISAAHGHWLGDAFASGGSHGYDHKKMGITARGAWEAVKRHFREMNVNIQTTPVTVAGVGDMSGDVFGNGMLLSRAIKLVAAFDHRDIFLDPMPDPERAHAERQRLFDLPRSSWQDYDKSLISQGGGVFSRQAKSIPLSPQVQAVLGIDRAEATPAEVMSAVLRAPVDLLWFGGIGTYIRASDETNDQAGDRANDAIRVAGAQLRCKVIGEGANLGVTQRGRIEAARHGVRLNSDAIDNSAGVNTSDVEVNLKIALATPERDGRLDEHARNDLLVAMTDEVAALVLRNNYLQTLALSLAERRGVGEIGFARRLMQMLEGEGRLARDVEFLPDDVTLAAREQRGEPLTRPELAVLLAYAKLALHDCILGSSVPDQPYLARELARYFPAELSNRFPDAVETHRLRREIIATQLANAIVNRGGPSVVARLVDQTGADAATIAAAYAVTRDAFGLMELNAAVDALDGVIPGQRQLALYADLQDLLLSRLVWFIRNVAVGSADLDGLVRLYRDGIAAVGAELERILPEHGLEMFEARLADLAAHGVPDDLARRLAALPALEAALDVVLIAQRAGAPVVDVAATHFAVAGAFRLGDLARAGREIAVADYYDRLALDRAIDGIASAHRKLTAEIVAAGGGNGAAAVEAWAERRGSDVPRIRGTVESIAATGLTLSKLTVASSLLGDLARG